MEQRRAVIYIASSVRLPLPQNKNKKPKMRHS
jgi:hypothetical protein